MNNDDSNSTITSTLIMIMVIVVVEMECFLDGCSGQLHYDNDDINDDVNMYGSGPVQVDGRDT